MKCGHVLKPDAYRDLCFLSSIEKTLSDGKTLTMENLQLDITEDRKLAYVATSSGIVVMPGKPFPYKVDPNSRPWYQRAVHARSFAVSVYQDFLWGDLVATISKLWDSLVGTQQRQYHILNITYAAYDNINIIPGESQYSIKVKFGWLLRLI